MFGHSPCGMAVYLVRCLESGREQQQRLGKQRNDLASVIAERWPDAMVALSPGRIVVEMAAGRAIELAQLAGLTTVSPCERVSRAELEATVLALARRRLSPATSFAIRVRRDRRDPGAASLDIARALADVIVSATKAPVDLTTPMVTIGIELRGDTAYVFDEIVQGVDRTGPRLPSATRPDGEVRFVADQMLGRLAARLRLLGYDTLTVFDIADSEVTRLAATDGRILLTRDGPLSRTLAVPVHFVVAKQPQAQLAEVLARFGLTPDRSQLFSRCTLCNTSIVPVEEAAVSELLPANVRGKGIELFRCPGCSQVYWHGSHVERILEDLAASGIRA